MQSNREVVCLLFFLLLLLLLLHPSGGFVRKLATLMAVELPSADIT